MPGCDGTLPGESIGFNVSFGPPGLAGASKSGPAGGLPDGEPPPPARGPDDGVSGVE